MRRWRHYRISPIVKMNFKWPNCHYRIYSCEIRGCFIVSKCPQIDLSRPIYGAKTDFSPVIWHRFQYMNRYFKSKNIKNTIIPFCIDRGELVAGGVAVERPFGVKICSFSSISFEIRIEIFSISDLKFFRKLSPKFFYVEIGILKLKMGTCDWPPRLFLRAKWVEFDSDFSILDLGIFSL